MAKKVTKVIKKEDLKEPESIKLTDILLLAKNKGFNGFESIYEIQGWIRNTVGLHAEIFYSTFHKKFSINNFFINVRNGDKISWEYKPINYLSYDEALIVALYNLLLLI